jgi:hypothetical protein
LLIFSEDTLSRKPHPSPAVQAGKGPTHSAVGTGVRGFRLGHTIHFFTIVNQQYLSDRSDGQQRTPALPRESVAEGNSIASCRVIPALAWCRGLSAFGLAQTPAGL